MPLNARANNKSYLSLLCVLSCSTAFLSGIAGKAGAVVGLLCPAAVGATSRRTGEPCEA
jgi:hypothetical protein